MKIRSVDRMLDINQIKQAGFDLVGFTLCQLYDQLPGTDTVIIRLEEHIPDPPLEEEENPNIIRSVN